MRLQNILERSCETCSKYDKIYLCKDKHILKYLSLLYVSYYPCDPCIIKLNAGKDCGKWRRKC